jgi:hypothetical protein
VSFTLTIQAGSEIKKPSPIREIKPRISVTSPAPGQTRWHACVGKTATINWAYLGDIGSTVNILLKGSSGRNITINSLPAGENLHGSYVWHIPENVSDGGKGTGGMFTVNVQAGNGSATAAGGKIEVLDPKLGPCPDK